MRLLPLFLLLMACDRSEQPAPPTAEEGQRLDRAESMLDKLANEEGPENASAHSGPNSHSDESPGQTD